MRKSVLYLNQANRKEQELQKEIGDIYQKILEESSRNITHRPRRGIRNGDVKQFICEFCQRNPIVTHQTSDMSSQYEQIIQDILSYVEVLETRISQSQCRMMTQIRSMSQIIDLIYMTYVILKLLYVQEQASSPTNDSPPEWNYQPSAFSSMFEHGHSLFKDKLSHILHTD